MNNSWPRLVCSISLALGCTSAAVVNAQAPRDPTQPPAAYGAPLASARTPVDVFKFEHLVTVGGVRYVVANSRRYAVGETIDGMRIERIADDAIWLRANGSTRRIPLFTGIEKFPLNGGASANTSTQTKVDGKIGLTK